MLNDEHDNIYLARHKWNERAAAEEETHRISSILDSWQIKLDLALLWRRLVDRHVVMIGCVSNLPG
jgi:hypothetical protein